ncbi:unnamed protein product [Caretta caretta]
MRRARLLEVIKERHPKGKKKFKTQRKNSELIVHKAGEARVLNRESSEEEQSWAESFRMVCCSSSGVLKPFHRAVHTLLKRSSPAGPPQPPTLTPIVWQLQHLCN